MGDNQASPEGQVTQQQIDYFEARARGGAGLLLVGSVGITFPHGIGTPKQTALSSDAYIAGFDRLASAVHHHGARLAVQLVHCGKAAVMDIHAGREMWVPSIPPESEPDPLMDMVTGEEANRIGTPYGGEKSRVAYHEMTLADIAQIAESFAKACERAREAGIDGVELHAGHGYLIDEFLSPTTNRRTDAYGGSLEKRARFLVEVLAAVRSRVGRDYPVWCRMNGEEYFIEGETLEDACRVAELAEAAGADAFHMSAYADPARAIGYSEAHATHFPGRFLPYAAAVKSRVSVPVITVGRLDIDAAERVLAEGDADFVAMGRALIADPELPNKLAAGTPERIRPCAYHYRCIGQIFLSSSVSCVVNPATGREREFSLQVAPESRRILVVGGGPAGLESARRAALRGHEVTLLEAGARLGGRFALAAHTAAPNAKLLRWLEGELSRLPVEVRLETRLEAAQIAALAPDHVIVATGARWPRPSIAGAQAPHVRSVDEMREWLEGGEAAEHLVVLGGDVPGLALAETARARGCAVRVLEESGVFAHAYGLPGRWRLVHQAREHGIELLPNTRAVEIREGTIDWLDAEGARHSAPADLVLVASGAEADTALLQALEERGVSASAVGDCRAVGLLENSMRDAAEATASL